VLAVRVWARTISASSTFAFYGFLSTAAEAAAAKAAAAI